MPTYNRWIGNAHGVAEVKTFTPSTINIGDVFGVEINNKQVTITVTSSTNKVSTLVPALVTALTASTIPEFQEITWESGTTAGMVTHVKGTGPADGTPWTATGIGIDKPAFGVTVEEVVKGVAAKNEKQKVMIPADASGGTFTLTFAGQTTAAIAYNASAATLETAFELLSTVDDVTVTGASPEWTIEFGGTQAATDVALITGNGSSLTGAGNVEVRTTTEGSVGTNEVQTLTIQYSEFGNQGFRLNTQWGLTQDIVTSAGGDISNQIDVFIGILNGISQADVKATRTSSTLNATTMQYTDVYRIEFRNAWAQTDVDLMTTAGPAQVLDDVVSRQIDATTTGSATNISEVQKVTVLGGPTGGTFTLTFEGQTTGTIAYDATAGAMETALEALSNITDVTVTKAGQEYTVTFVNPTGDVDQMTATPTSLTGGSVIAATVQSAVAGVNEVQSVALDQNARSGTFTLTYDSQTTGTIAYNADADTVQTALEALSNIAAGEVEVSGADGGPYVVEFKAGLGATDVVLMSGDGTALGGSGNQLMTAATSTTGTGPNFWDNADNWSAGTIPADDETLVFENTDVSLLHKLSQAATTPEAIIIDSSFTGDIGLRRHNDDYVEYRATELRVATDGDGSNQTIVIDVGRGEGNGSGLIRIDTGDKQTTLSIYRTGVSNDGDAPALNWRSTHASSVVNAFRGDIGIGWFKDQSVTVLTLNQGYVDNVDNDAQVRIGDDATIGTVNKVGGTLESMSNFDTSLTNRAGNVNLEQNMTVRELILTGGTVFANSSGNIGHRGGITGITQANPAVVTSASHGLATGDKIRIGGVVGMTEVNQREFTIAQVDANSFQLVGEDSTSHTAYGSVGVWAKLESIVVAGDGILDFSQNGVARTVGPAIDVYGDSAEVIDTAKAVTTETYLSGQFAINWHHTTRNDNLGLDFVEIRQD